MNQDDARPTDAAYRQLVEQTQEYAILMLDRDGIILNWNKGAENIFGWTPSEVTGQPGGLIFTPEDRAAGVPEEELATALARGQAADDRWHLRKDGSFFWANGILTAHYDHAGKLERFSKILRDNTDLRDAQLQLKDSRDFFQGVTEALPDIVWTANARGEVDYCNERWTTYTGLLRTDAYGSGWLSAVHPDDHGIVRQAWDQVLTTDSALAIEHRV
jgi:PAS domain S-box-containing protein